MLIFGAVYIEFTCNHIEPSWTMANIILDNILWNWEFLKVNMSSDLGNRLNFHLKLIDSVIDLCYLDRIQGLNLSKLYLQDREFKRIT